MYASKTGADYRFTEHWNNVSGIHNLWAYFLDFLNENCYCSRVFRIKSFVEMLTWRKLLGVFGGAAAATALVSAPPAYADSAAVTPASVESPDGVYDPERDGCSNPTGRAFTPAEALALSHQCDGVIYYGENISQAAAERAAAGILRRDGYHVVAVPGFPQPDGVGSIRNGRGIGGIMTESDLYRGHVAGELVRDIQSAGKAPGYENTSS